MGKNAENKYRYNILKGQERNKTNKTYKQRRNERTNDGREGERGGGREGGKKEGRKEGR